MARKLRRGGSHGKPRGLNPRHLEFVRLMVEGRTKPIEAARQTGYRNPNQMAWNLMRLPRYAAVQEAIRKGREAAWERAVASGAEVLARVSLVLRDREARHADVLAAAKLLLQYHGLLTERVEVQGQVDVVHWDLSALTDEEVEQLHALSLRAAVPAPSRN